MQEYELAAVSIILGKLLKETTMKEVLENKELHKSETFLMS